MKITLVGLDQVGTSIGLALKAVSDAFEIVGHDPYPARSKRALKLRAVDSTHWNLISACEGAELVLINVSLPEIAPTFQALGKELTTPTTLIDTTAVKRPVMALAQQHLAAHAFVGGHLIAPAMIAEHEPSAELFQDGLFYFIASKGLPAAALDRASNLAEALGARPSFVDAAEHDGLMAAMAQLPLLTNLAVLQALVADSGSHDRSQAAGALQAALGRPPAVSCAEELVANADNLIYWLDQVVAQLGALRAVLAQGEVPPLVAELESVAARLDLWGQTEQEAPAEVARPSIWRTMFLGNWGRTKP
jgi:prephenate dehydrogenase